MPFYDYHFLPVGHVLKEGEIKVCPHCGKPGLAEQVNGMDFYTHAMGWKAGPLDLQQSILEMCPKPLARPEPHG